jgi:glyoxylase-like metal-dependent hydrolase (beta-lactamase superfamily II)
MSRPSLRAVLAPNPSAMTLEGTWTYILGRERPVVIDPGPDVDEHVERVREMLGRATPAAIVVTHGHPDHSGAAAELAAATGAAILFGRGALHDPFPPGAPLQRVADGERVEFDGGTIELLQTPGHAPEHLCVGWDGAGGSRVAFAGDLLMGRGDTTLVAPPEGDLSLYLTSLDRLGRFSPSVIYPAHGPPILDPRRALERYRRHRIERVEQVRRALRARPPLEGEELLRAIYGDQLDPSLRRAAEGSLEALVRYVRAER